MIGLLTPQGETLPIPEGTTIRFEFNFDVTSLDNMPGAGSLTFKVSANREIQRHFGFLHVYESESKLRSTDLYTITYFGQPVFSGIIGFKEANNRYYEIYLKTANSIFEELLGDATVRDILAGETITIGNQEGGVAFLDFNTYSSPAPTEVLISFSGCSYNTTDPSQINAAHFATIINADSRNGDTVNHYEALAEDVNGILKITFETPFPVFGGFFLVNAVAEPLPLTAEVFPLEVDLSSYASVNSSNRICFPQIAMEKPYGSNPTRPNPFPGDERHVNNLYATVNGVGPITQWENSWNALKTWNYQLVPCLYVSYILDKIFEFMGIEKTGTFFNPGVGVPDPLADIILVNNRTIDQVIERNNGTEYKNVHKRTFPLSDHTPHMKAYDFLMVMRQYFNLSFFFDIFTRKMNINFLDPVLADTDAAKDWTKYISPKYKIIDAPYKGSRISTGTNDDFVDGAAQYVVETNIKPIAVAQITILPPMGLLQGPLNSDAFNNLDNDSYALGFYELQGGRPAVVKRWLNPLELEENFYRRYFNSLKKQDRLEAPIDLPLHLLQQLSPGLIRYDDTVSLLLRAEFQLTRTGLRNQELTLQRI